MIPFHQIEIHEELPNRNLQVLIKEINKTKNNGIKNACHGKVRFSSIKEARKLIREKAFNKKVYLCPFCGFFHIGEDRKSGLGLSRYPFILELEDIMKLNISTKYKTKLLELYHMKEGCLT